MRVESRSTEASTTTPIGAGARMCVLASGSGGNCTAVVRGDGDARRITLLDLGIGPRRVGRLLDEHGLSIDQVDDALLTHLDTDHCRDVWTRWLPGHATVWLHKRHARAARRHGLEFPKAEAFDDVFTISGGAAVRPTLHAHDALGVAVYRIDFGGASLGFATDLGRVTPALVDHLRGVDVLAIESNYCPRLQLASSRPVYLKRRIMGGSGHLSNEECAQAVRDIRPGGRVVLLHLSRECNTPDAAAAVHDGREYRLTVTSQHRPTKWVGIRRDRAAAPTDDAHAAAVMTPVQPTLF